jgi:hypothetical protein
MHAAIEFTVQHPRVTSDWHRSSNTLVLLAAPDEWSLGLLGDDADAAGLRLARFHEPDLGFSLTAVALEPAARRLVSRLPLAFGFPPPTRPSRDEGR